MNKLDKDYQALLQDILDNGTQKGDRTGTGTISVFGRQIRHTMKDGFPLLTTKKMYFKGIVTELLWFLRGDTNIKYLVDNDCHIWDGDAYKRYVKWVESPKNQNNKNEIVKIPMSKENFIKTIKGDDEIVKKMGKKYCDEFAKKWGDLGSVYGKQWRKWKFTDKFTNGQQIAYVNGKVDQIANLIRDLKTNPDSRRLMVSAWNVGELDNMTLPPCHYSFQVYTRELSLNERLNLVSTIIGEEKIRTHEDNLERVDKLNMPTRAISLMFNMRSNDVPLGLPFNIASYAILLEIIGKMVNMVPDELIANLGDAHIYMNQIDGCKEQIGRELRIDERVCMCYENPKLDLNKLQEGMTDDEFTKVCDEFGIPTRTREPYPLPKLVISNKVNFNEGIDEFLNSCLISDFNIEGYQSHPTIKMPLSN